MIRLFGHYISKTYLLLGLLEYLVAFYALPLGLYARFGFDPGRFPEDVSNLWVTSAIFALSVSVAMTAVGMYQRGLVFTAGLLVRLGLAFLLASMALSLLFYAFPQLVLGRGVVGLGMLFTLVGVIILRSFYFRLLGDEAREHRILVLGAGRQAKLIHDLEADSPPFTVAGYVPMGETEQAVPRERRVVLQEPLLTYLVRHEIDEMVVAPDDRRGRLPVEDILDCKMSGIRVLDLLSFFEKETSRINIDILHPSWIFFSNGFVLGGIGDYFKRLLDIAGALLILIVGAPLMLLVALAILIESHGRGPVFFHQTRVGLNGQPFRVHKFRSMRTDAEADGVARWASDNDSRITRVGAFIRKTRLDEMPQAFNILRGDMSLVGPRPERPEFVAQLAREIPFYNERHRVKPGLTGWAQLCYSYGATTEDARMKLQYDLYYVKNASLFLDLVVLLETVEVVLWGKGAR
jgi:sugar transferase (PEP-CTERM system associated)